MELFTFEVKPYWRPYYSDGMDTLLREIPTLLERIKKFVDDKSNKKFLKGFIDEYRQIYIYEICSGENKIIGTLINGRFELDEGTIKKRDLQKVTNLSEAIRYAFGEKFSSYSYKHHFTVKFAKELNRIIGNGLFGNAGNYRHKHAKPSGYDFFYLEPIYIEDNMNKLFENMSEETEKDLEWMEWIELAAKFFERFLLIHPFSNGNGRTARILLSVVLIKKTIVPVSLFSPSFKYTCNAEYLHCLEEAHAYGNKNLLNSLIIESIHRVCHMFINILDIESDD